jgi:phosphoglycerol transferase MdoB-like AlkP superfamily enzyme
MPVVAVVTILVCQPTKNSSRMKEILTLLSGIIAGLLPFIVFLALTNQLGSLAGDIGLINFSVPQNQDLFSGLRHEFGLFLPLLFSKIPIALAFSFLFIVLYYKEYKREFTTKALVIWIIVGIVILSLVAYQPLRRHILLLPPISIFAAMFLQKIARKKIAFWGVLLLVSLFGIFSYLVVLANSDTANYEMGTWISQNIPSGKVLFSVNSTFSLLIKNPLTIGINGCLREECRELSENKVDYFIFDCRWDIIRYGHCLNESFDKNKLVKKIGPIELYSISNIAKK